ncbi:DNA-3-methyladenine glycosylase 2 family protein [Methylovirgula sp. 4M-Z18]|nr:DNA-3-methyladenine glycosylase 2 family protein [Methylovirgula sp. 4M-Z18]
MLERAGHPPLRHGRRGFDGLVSIVVSQQVSVASADAIFGRLKAAFRELEPQAILAASDDDLKACGLSRPKMRTINALAEAIHTGALPLEQLGTMPPEEAHATLVAVHGIGPWTADIYLLFCLGHPDAWPVGDIALQEAAKLALNLKKRPDAKALHKIGERWRPWRGVAARLLWTYYRAVKAREGVKVD